MFTVALLIGNLWAIEFSVDGIKYNMLSSTDMTCEVIAGDYKGDIVIPATVNYNGRELTVVQIGARAFYGCDEVTNISLPNTITTLCDYAFLACTGLEKFTIPGSVRTLGAKVFSNTGFSELRIENGESYFTCNDYSVSASKRVLIFENCPNLKKVYLDRGLPSEHTDMAWDSLYGVYTPFYGNQTICELEYGPNALGSSRFSNCPNLTKIKLPKEGKFMLQDYAFCLCPIEEIEGLENCYYFGIGALENSGNLGDYSIEDNVEYIYKEAFLGTNLKKINSHNPDLVVKQKAFQKCNELKEAYLNGDLSAELFNRCENIESLTFGPQSELSLGVSRVIGATASTPEYDTAKIKDLYILTSYIPKTDAFNDWTYVNTTLHVLPELLEQYKATQHWMDFWNIKGDAESAVETISDAAPRIEVENRIIKIQDNGNQIYRVYSLSGNLIYEGVAKGVEVQSSGLYIVTSTNMTATKVIVK